MARNNHNIDTGHRLNITAKNLKKWGHLSPNISKNRSQYRPTSRFFLSQTTGISTTFQTPRMGQSHLSLSPEPPRLPPNVSPQPRCEKTNTACIETGNVLGRCVAQEKLPKTKKNQHPYRILENPRLKRRPLSRLIRPLRTRPPVRQ